MAVELVVGAGLELVFDQALKQLSNAVKDVIGKDFRFKPSLERLQSTINSINPVIDQMEEFNRILDRPEEETNKLIQKIVEGESLIHKCSKIRWFNSWAKPEYARKIEQLDHSILRFFQLDLPAQTARDVKETLVRVNSVHAILDHGNSIARRGGTCAVPKPPDGIVGMDVPLKELKMELFKDEVSLLVLTAPAGCGKTTLVKMLGHDEQIKGKFEGSILFVTVSNAPNLKVIVQRLFNHMGGMATEFHNDEDAINQLEQLLLNQPNPILLILDDVWSGSESLLDKFAFRNQNYKILVTSRFAFPRFHNTYN